MDKGIRPYCNAKFAELNEQRRRNLLTNTAFRAAVMFDVMEQFSCTLAAAATHYNHAFKNLKELNAELVSGLGRAEDKKGGRKPKDRGFVGPLLPTEVVEELDPMPEVQVLFNVCKKADGSVFAEGLCFEDAKALIAKHAAQKKAKLYWI